jgi:hypothetical protein
MIRILITIRQECQILLFKRPKRDLHRKNNSAGLPEFTFLKDQNVIRIVKTIRQDCQILLF